MDKLTEQNESGRMWQDGHMCPDCHKMFNSLGKLISHMIHICSARG